MIGTDFRDPSQTRQDVKDFGRVGGRRADTIILVQAVPTERRAVLVQFPRDLYVPIPGRREGKINSSFEDGPDKVIQTVQGLTGIPINHYVEVNFYGFRHLVDAVGGVDVCLDQPLRDSQLRFRLPAGVTHLDGKTALSFVRSRHSDPDGDFGRIRRQQQFLRTIVAKLGQPSILLNPLRVHNLATAFAANVTTDRDFKLGDLARLARHVRSVKPEQMQTFTVPGEIGRARRESVVLLDRERADVLFRALREVRDPEQALAPQPVEVAVEDASGKALGSSVAAELGKRGFVVSRTATLPTIQSRTEVHSPRVRANDARRLIGVVPGSRLLFKGADIRLVIGSRFGGLAKAPKGEAPRPGGPCQNFNSGA